ERPYATVQSSNSQSNHPITYHPISNVSATLTQEYRSANPLPLKRLARLQPAIRTGRYGRLARVRIVIDYRPALKARTGVGEYIHQTIKALGRGGSEDRITLFSSSWKDRPSAETMSELPRARVVDRRIPVRFLNLAWHRLGWPSVETLTADRYDVAHSPHPLLLPSRS